MDTKVTFDLSAATVTIEGPGDVLTRLFDAVRGVAPNLEVRVIPAQTSPVAPAAPAPTSARVSLATAGARAASASSVPTSVNSLQTFRRRALRVGRAEARQFAQRYAAKTTVDRIVVLAAYAATYLGTFSAQQMTEWFDECGFEQPANMSVALNDARLKAVVLERAKRNQWALTQDGVERLATLDKSTTP
jgi:hypothetical protein